MSAHSDVNASIRKSAEHTLETFEMISSKVKEELARGAIDASNVLVNSQSMNSDNAVRSLSSIQREKLDNLLSLEKEPAVCRVVALDEDGEERTYYICRAMPVILKDNTAALASYRAPIGRIASFTAGEECTIIINGQDVSFEILERIQLRPEKKETRWDSINNSYQNIFHGSFSLESLRTFLLEEMPEQAEELFEAILAGEGGSSLIEGLRREVLSKMGLRDQPILDKFQDGIFREHLSSQLLITGPPDTGKTTTLIRRLGQKLNIEFLDEDEKSLVNVSDTDSLQKHKTSWLMFTPTELLKQYIKEAFAKENIAAPDERLRTWDEYRRYLSRSVLGILKTSTPGGTFIFKDRLSILKIETIKNPIGWHDDFSKFFVTEQIERLENGLKNLGEIEKQSILELKEKISKCMVGISKNGLLSTYARLAGVEKEISSIVATLANESQEITRHASVEILSEHREFFTDFAIFLDSINSDDSIDVDEDDDDDAFDDDDSIEKQEMTTPREAIRAYWVFLKSYARAKVQKRKITEQSKNGKILKWLAGRIPSEEIIDELGMTALIQNSLRRFVNPAKKFLRDVPKTYRKFRKVKTQSNDWYLAKPDRPNHISSLELDIIILTMLKNARELLGQSFVKRELSDTRHELLRSISREFKNQVLVDEATDFSVIQLSCMFNLTNLSTKSFFACGDFNQRITTWGCSSIDQIKWISGRMDFRPINISYRQSKQLNNFSNQLLDKVLNSKDSINLPPGIECKGVQPALLEKYN